MATPENILENSRKVVIMISEEEEQSRIGWNLGSYFGRSGFSRCCGNDSRSSCNRIFLK